MSPSHPSPSLQSKEEFELDLFWFQDHEEPQLLADRVAAWEGLLSSESAGRLTSLEADGICQDSTFLVGI